MVGGLSYLVRCSSLELINHRFLYQTGLNAQAPCVTEVEVGGLSVYDVNEIFPVRFCLYAWPD